MILIRVYYRQCEGTEILYKGIRNHAEIRQNKKIVFNKVLVELFIELSPMTCNGLNKKIFSNSLIFLARTNEIYERRLTRKNVLPLFLQVLDASLFDVD